MTKLRTSNSSDHINRSDVTVTSTTIKNSVEAKVTTLNRWLMSRKREIKSKNRESIFGPSNNNKERDDPSLWKMEKAKKSRITLNVAPTTPIQTQESTSDYDTSVFGLNHNQTTSSPSQSNSSLSNTTDQNGVLVIGNNDITTSTNDRINQPPSDGTTVPPTYSLTPIGFSMMTIVFLLFLATISLILYRYCKRRQMQIQFEQGYTPRRKATKLRIQRRYETIEHWIVTKRVLDHDDFCIKVVTNFSHHYNHSHVDNTESSIDKKEKPQQNQKDQIDEQQLMEQAQDEEQIFQYQDPTDAGHVSDSLDCLGVERELNNGTKDTTDCFITSSDGVVTTSSNSNDRTTTSINESFVGLSSDDEEMNTFQAHLAYSKPCKSTSLTSDIDDLYTNSFQQQINEKEEQTNGDNNDPASFLSTDIDDCDDQKNDRISTGQHREDVVTDVEDDDVVHHCVPHTEDHEERECPVCICPFQIGDIVSWSANTACSHVYHHECIKEWLLRHTDCCLCKQIMLPVDEKRGKTAKQEALQELSARYASSASTSYYCISEGLVRIPKTVRCTRKELRQLEHKIFHGTVAPPDLVSLRGRRQELMMKQDEAEADVVDDDIRINVQIVDTGNTSSMTSSTAGNTTNHTRIYYPDDDIGIVIRQHQQSNIDSDDHGSIGSQGERTSSVEGAHSPLSESSTSFRQQQRTSSNTTSNSGVLRRIPSGDCVGSYKNDDDDIEAPSSRDVHRANPLDQQVQHERNNGPMLNIEEGVETIASLTTSSTTPPMFRTKTASPRNASPIVSYRGTTTTYWSPAASSESEQPTSSPFQSSQSPIYRQRERLTSTTTATMTTMLRTPSPDQSTSQLLSTIPSPRRYGHLLGSVGMNSSASVGNTTHYSNGRSRSMPNSRPTLVTDSTMVVAEEWASSSDIMVPHLTPTAYPTLFHNNNAALRTCNLYAQRGSSHSSPSVCGINAGTNVVTNNSMERLCEGESASSNSGSSENELVVATSYLEKSNVIGDNRCRVVENNEVNHDETEEGVEVHATVSMPLYEE